MKILFVCHRFPYPPIRGGKIRPFHMIRHLGRRHEVTVASLARTAAEASEGRGIAEHCSDYLVATVSPLRAAAAMVARLPTPVPSSMGYFHSPRLARAIRRRLAAERFDLALVHCSSVAQYVAGARGLPKILDFGDMDSQKWLAYAEARRFPLSLGYHLEGRKLARAEAELARRFDYSTCTTRAEWETLESFGTAQRSGWIPNGVDSDRFRPGADPYDPDTLCFVGRMDYFPNQDAVLGFCREVLPRIRAERPGAKLVVVGAAPPRRIRRLAELPGVTVTGTVPDVRPWVRSAALTVAPLRIARGTQNKILESMAMGVPTVSSEIAARGVDAVPGEHLLAASEPQDFAAAVLRLLGDPAERRRLAAAARQRVLTHHAWEGSMRRLDAIVAETMDRAPAPPEAAG